MKTNEIIQWQWDGYKQYHNTPINLWIHILAAPLFIIGTILLITAIIGLSFFMIIASSLIMAVSILAQGFGHSKETHPVEPFIDGKNAVTRIFIEQFYTFPKYVISGKWYRALKQR